jgi:cytochrome c-type biogenesis protein CcmH
VILSFLLAALAFLTLLAIVAPLLRGRRGAAPRASYDQAVYRDQLRELDRDIERGLVTQDEAGSARLEIQRRLLATERDTTTQAASGHTPRRTSHSPVMAGVVFLLVAGGSIGTYLWIGTPGLPDMPFANRVNEATATDRQAMDLQRQADQLAAQLKANPSDAQGWQRLGSMDAALSRWDDAAAAYRHAMDLGQADADTMGSYGESLVMGAGGTVTPAAEDTFHKALAADPASGVARYYLAIAASQAGEPQKAIDMLQALLADMPADSPLRGQVGGRVADIARGAGMKVPELAKGIAPAVPSNPDNMTDAQREAMIQGMVARLAAKQEADPTNLDGWMRLGRAYAVLHDMDKAEDAYDKAMALKPDDGSIPLQAAQDLTRAQNPREPLSPRLVALLRKVQAANPKEPAVLWFLGIAAVQAKHPEDAKRYWTDLLEVLPPASQDAHTVQAALDLLAKASGG